MAPITQINEPIPPQTAIGDFRVGRRFAGGGMGDLYEVVNPLLRETFAMKVLREDPNSPYRRESITRFFDEARMTARLRHGNIVTLHTMGLEPTRGRVYFIMDYVGLSPARRDEILGDGPWFSTSSTTVSGSLEPRVPLTLEDVLKQRGPIPEETLRILAADVAQALFYAHNAGIIHCDLKPSNILLRNDGHAVVTDFGIARVRQSTPSADSESAGVFGTPQYMAPEQRDPFAMLTPATDIYAYGVTLYRLLTGSFPNGAWQKPSALGFNPAWDRLFHDCLAANPADRWPTMRRVHAWLRAMPEIQRRAELEAKRKRALKRGLLLSACIAGPLLLLLPGLFLLSKTFSRPALTPLRWNVPLFTPAAFRNGDPAAALPRADLEGPLVYGPTAPASLPMPPEPCPHVSQIALPRHISALPAAFATAFPRLEYIACDSDNPTFFAQDGILYRRDNPETPLILPPRLYGSITLPPEVTHLRHPWPNAQTTPTDLTSSSGAYGRPLRIHAVHPIRWIAPSQTP